MNKWFIMVLVLVLIIAGVFISSRTDRTPQISQESATTQLPTQPEEKIAKTYTLEEVTNHDHESDCWMAIEGKVYDVTDFIPKHEGGKAILNGCGKDATVLFNERPSDNKGPHPETAKAMLANFYIGDLEQ